MSDAPITIALVGNPNSGKTSLLNQMTGGKDSVGNYPRVTVDVKERELTFDGRKLMLADLPGIYALTSQSAEELSAREYIMAGHADVIINVIDAGNLERSLYLTTQLVEMGKPLLFALNMVDEVESVEGKIDVQALESMLGAPVLRTSGKHGDGVKALLSAAISIFNAGQAPARSFVHYDAHLEEAVQRVQHLVQENHAAEDAREQEGSRWMAIKLLEGDIEMMRDEQEHQHLLELVRRECYDLSHGHGMACESMFADARFGHVHGIISEAVQRSDKLRNRYRATRVLDTLFINRVLGIPIFVALLWVMFETTFTLGEVPMNWIDAGVGAFSDWMAALLPEGLFKDLVVEGMIAGVGGTIIFLPNIVILFFFMALFSETGYLARAAFLMDQVMHKFGLHGKALIPLVMGFGCNVPAVMSARTIESDKARLVTILVNPFMLCAARLPVFILFAGAFFTQNAGTVVFAMYMLSIVGAMGAAVILNRFLFRDADEAFVMELPPYRIPTLRAVFIHMWDKAVTFLQKIAGVILVGSVVIWFLQTFPQEVEWSTDYAARIEQAQAQPESPARNAAIGELQRQRNQEALEKSYLGQIAHTVAPVFTPLEFTWKDTVAILTGFVAKEVVVASYAVLYSQDSESTEESDTLRQVLAGTMTPLVAVAFMVFALFYSPCIATIAAIKREAGGWRWALFSVGFSLTIAYSLAFLVVKVGGALT
ncbi:ferrous iron transport protein B [Magnetofaba australis]|uniref:Ferrous iron transport protein B n=1 Tax=Magnetofaba australis IT-1 TaxID=1434232 RepID=W0LN83_9PROT|nr:ferrous iron transport protein B [Magnetofaba australis]AHG23912.1 ferrous iron transporter B [Magnetofaba australis IT-1]OSM08659.1 putative Ferrous iron transporter B [Magnetofaba australis IT-1]